jgi:hypothetical protein
MQLFPGQLHRCIEVLSLLYSNGINVFHVNYVFAYGVIYTAVISIIYDVIVQKTVTKIKKSLFFVLIWNAWHATMFHML